MSKLAIRIALALSASLVFSACAEAPPARSKAFKVEPTAPQPGVVVRWTTRLDDMEFFTKSPTQFATPHHVGSTDELLVGTANGELFKFQAANGHQIWKADLGSSISAQPSTGQGYAFVGLLDGRLVALDLVTGKEAWAYEARSSIEQRPVFAEGRVLFSDVSDNLYALDAATGELLWTQNRKAPDYFTMQGSCEPTIVDGEVYCGFADGHLAAFQLETGEELWKVDLSGEADEFTDVDGAVIVTEDVIYASSYASGLYAVDRFSGEIVWNYPLTSVSSMRFADGMLYLSSALGRIVAVDAVAKKPVWSFRMKEAIPTGLITYGPYVVATSNQGLYLLDRSTGFPFGRTRGTAGFSARIEFGGDRAYTMSDHGRVVAFALGW